MIIAQPLPFLDDVPNHPEPHSGYWSRSGSCDQCAAGPIKGECCTRIAFPISPSAARNPDAVHFFTLHGAEVKWWGEMPLIVIPLKCSALLPNGDCSLYGQPERPDVCSSGPLNAWATQLNSHCSYQFERVEE